VVKLFDVLCNSRALTCLWWNVGSEQIAQSTSSVFAENTITISLQSTVGIQSLGFISNAITIKGLASGFVGDGQTGQILVTNKGYNSIQGLFVGNSATWDKTEGTLVFRLAPGQQLGAGKLYVFSVALRNPRSAQPSPQITIENSGAPGQVVTMKKASGSSEPLLVEAPAFKVLRIGQKFSGASVSNELTVTLKPNLRLEGGTRFVIEGLTGSGTSDTAELPLSGCDGVFNAAGTGKTNFGKWSKSIGTLELIAAKAIDIDNPSIIVCSFSLINPAQLQEAADVLITVKSAGASSNLIGPEKFRNAPDKKAPFMVSPATFLEARISQSSPYPGEPQNKITISLQSNVAVGSAGGIVSSITITGLTGSETSDTRSLPLSGSFATSLASSSAVWIKSSGTVILTIGDSKTMEANTPYTISFLLANPTQEQKSPAVSISYSGAQAISTMVMSSDTKSSIHNAGDAAPLFVYPRGFLKKAIGVRATWPQASNLLSITLQTSVAISSLPTAQTLISISGLKFASNSDLAVPITSSDPSLFGTSAELSSGEGSLVVKILPGGAMQAGKQYQINMLVENTAQETLFTPKVSVTGPVMIGASNMTYRGVDSPTQVSFTSSAPNVDVGMTFSFTTRNQILKSDSIIVMLPGFVGTSTKLEHQIWGVTSDPPAFEIQANDVEYGDAIAGGNSVAQAKYRVGRVSRTQVASSETDGEKGSTIVLDSADASVLGTSNLYAGMQISIEGSSSYHSIYQQTASASQQPAVAHFFPKYKYGATEASAVPAGATYSILSQIEFTSKENIPTGTKISITVPGGSGIISPLGGIQKDSKVSMSHVKTGIASAAIGTPDAITTEMVSSSTHLKVTLDDIRPDYFGLPWAPMRIPPSSVVFVDGFRTIIQFSASASAKEVTLMTGYGPMRKTKLSSAAEVEMKGSKLNQSKNIGQSSEWLTLSSVASISPALVQGSYLQLEDEIIRYTGIKASAVESIALPETLGSGCKDREGALCGAECASISVSDCPDAPETSVLFNSSGAVQSFIVRYGGACPAGTSLKFQLKLANGVTCSTSPDCGSGCVGTLTTEQNVIKVQRAQFSTDATNLTTCANSKCDNTLKPSTVYVENNGLESLLYTSSTNELNHAKKQTVKIGYKQIVDTVVAGDHVTSITVPQTAGSCKAVSNGVGLCTGSGCANIFFSGCSVNPEASLTFANGAITAVVVKSGGICQASEVLAGKIALGDGTMCDVIPNCGTGCTSTFDDSKDALIIKHRAVDKASDITHKPGDDVVRVHAVESDIGYKIVMVPPTTCGVVDAAKPKPKPESTNLSPGQCAVAPKAQTVVSWIDPETNGVLASMYAAQDGLSSLCLDFTSGSNRPYYPPGCNKSCNNRTADGNYVASKPVNISFQYQGNSTPIDVVLTMPITFNTARSRRVAPENGEYRLNGNCKCPSFLSSFVNCTIQSSGVYQAHLMQTSTCAADPYPYHVLAAVLGAAGGLCVIIACAYGYYVRSAPKEEPIQEKAELEEGDAGYEGPVYVGRPVPLIPTMQPLAVILPNISPAPINMSVAGVAPAPANRAASPIFMADAIAWNNSHSYVGSLPTTLTPAARPGTSPRFSMSSSGAPRIPSSESPRRGRDEGLSMSSPRQQSVSPESRRSPPQSARVPYGV
jgi:hypothetical protein